MSNKWKYSEEDDDSDKNFEKFDGTKKKIVPEEYRHEDNKKLKKPPRKLDEIGDDEDE
jgi:hypothetical protein